MWRDIGVAAIANACAEAGAVALAMRMPRRIAQYVTSAAVLPCIGFGAMCCLQTDTIDDTRSHAGVCTLCVFVATRFTLDLALRFDPDFQWLAHHATVMFGITYAYVTGHMHRMLCLQMLVEFTQPFLYALLIMRHLDVRRESALYLINGACLAATYVAFRFVGQLYALHALFQLRGDVAYAEWVMACALASLLFALNAVWVWMVLHGFARALLRARPRSKTE